MPKLEVGILNIMEYLLWIILCLLLTENINFLLVKQESFDQYNFFFLSFEELRNIRNSNFSKLANKRMIYQGQKCPTF